MNKIEKKKKEKRKRKKERKRKEREGLCFVDLSLLRERERERDGREEDMVDCDGGGICVIEEHPWGRPIQVLYVECHLW